MKENTHLDCFREAGPHTPIKQKGRGPVPKQQVGSLLEGLKSVPGMANMGAPPPSLRFCFLCGLSLTFSASLPVWNDGRVGCVLLVSRESDQWVRS